MHFLRIPLSPAVSSIVLYRVASNPTSDAPRESSSEPPSQQHHYSLECTGLERSLTDCKWSIKDQPGGNLAMVLCKRGEPQRIDS